MSWWTLHNTWKHSLSKCIQYIFEKFTTEPKLLIFLWWLQFKVQESQRHCSQCDLGSLARKEKLLHMQVESYYKEMKKQSYLLLLVPFLLRNCSTWQGPWCLLLLVGLVHRPFSETEHNKISTNYMPIPNAMHMILWPNEQLLINRTQLQSRSGTPERLRELSQERLVKGRFRYQFGIIHLPAENLTSSFIRMTRSILGRCRLTHSDDRRNADN